MTYRYLTRSYVDALGLQQVPVQTLMLNVISNWHRIARFDNEPHSWSPCRSATLPGVLHDGAVYVMEDPDGLSYTRPCDVVEGL